MRKFCLLLFLFLSLRLNAQITNGNNNIFICVNQPDRSNIPAEATTQIVNKMNQFLSQNGIVSTDQMNRFVLTCRADITSKDIIPGPPQKVSIHVDFTFIIGDAEENKIFESFTISSLGIGINENKAFIEAFMKIKPKNSGLVEFLEKSKEEIVDYYSFRCSDIKSQAEREANLRNYDKAIYLLMMIPNVCDCANDCQELMIKYAVENLNNQAAALLNQARAVWASSPNSDGASAAADIIAQIPANTTSQSGINKLTNEITNKLKADERRAWEFKMRQYNDKIEKQKRDDAARLEQQRADNHYKSTQQAANNEYRRVQQAANNSARVQAIETARQVGLAYAKNQPKSLTINYQKNILLW